jgi:hypothetical protein
MYQFLQYTLWLERYNILFHGHLRLGILYYGKIHKLSHSIWNKENMSYKCTEFITVRIQKSGDETNGTSYQDVTYQFHTKCQLHTYTKLLVISVDFGVTYQLLNRYSTFLRLWRKNPFMWPRIVSSGWLM